MDRNTVKALNSLQRQVAAAKKNADAAVKALQTVSDSLQQLLAKSESVGNAAPAKATPAKAADKAKPAAQTKADVNPAADKAKPVKRAPAKDAGVERNTGKVKNTTAENAAGDKIKTKGSNKPQVETKKPKKLRK